MKTIRMISIVAMLMSGIIPAALAVEHGGQPMTEKSRTTASTTAQTQQTWEAEGSVTGLELQGTTPTLAVRGANGQTWNFTLNSQGTTVWTGSQLGSLSQLKLGEQVKVRYAQQGAAKLAKSVRIAPPAEAASSAQPAGSQAK